MTEATTFNPYAHVARQARALLRAEEHLPPEQREAIEWVLLTKFCGTQLVVAKGGANTLAIKLGNGERRIDFPNKIVGELELLARQSFVLYIVQTPERSVRTYHRDAAFNRDPIKQGRIYGVRVDGSRKLIAEARRNISGKMKWLKA